MAKRVVFRYVINTIARPGQTEPWRRLLRSHRDRASTIAIQATAQCPGDRFAILDHSNVSPRQAMVATASAGHSTPVSRVASRNAPWQGHCCQYAISVAALSRYCRRGRAVNFTVKIGTPPARTLPRLLGYSKQNGGCRKTDECRGNEVPVRARGALGAHG